MSLKEKRAYQPSVPSLKNILMKHWQLIENHPLLRQIYKKPPIISYKRRKAYVAGAKRGWSVILRTSSFSGYMARSNQLINGTLQTDLYVKPTNKQIILPSIQH